MDVSETAALLVRSCRDGGRRSRPLKSWRFIGISSLLYRPDLDAPNGHVHQTVQRHVYLEGLTFSSREKPSNTVYSAFSSSIRGSYRSELLNNSRRETKFCWYSQGACWKKNESIGKQMFTSSLAQAFHDSARARSKVTRCASVQSSRSHRARVAMRVADRSRV